jgi:hypothetical protein
MGNTLVMHIDDAPWSYGGPDRPDEFGDQVIGDRERGPWIEVINLPPGHPIAPHHHNEDEIRYVVKGSMVMDGQTYGPGTVYYTEQDTDYSFTAGPQGLRYLACFSGPIYYQYAGKEEWVTP